MREWSVSMPLEDAVAMGSDAAKAVVIARAYLKEDAKRKGLPSAGGHVLRPTKTASGWSVYAAPAYGTLAPGGFATVEMGEDWKVRRVMGGA